MRGFPALAIAAALAFGLVATGANAAILKAPHVTAPASKGDADSACVADCIALAAPKVPKVAAGCGKGQPDAADLIGEVRPPSEAVSANLLRPTLGLPRVTATFGDKPTAVLSPCTPILKLPPGTKVPPVAKIPPLVKLPPGVFRKAAAPTTFEACGDQLGSLRRVTVGQVRRIGSDDTVHLVPLCDIVHRSLTEQEMSYLSRGNVQGLLPTIGRNDTLVAGLEDGGYEANDVIGIALAPQAVVLYVSRR